MAKRTFLMLAENYKPGTPIGGYFYSEKLDGMRAVWDGGVSKGMDCREVPWANVEKDARYVTPPRASGLWTRYGKPIQAPRWWLEEFPDHPLDGELWIGRGQFQSLMSIAKKLLAPPTWSNIKYMVFDVPPYHALFANGEIKETNFKKIFSDIDSRIKLPDFKLQDWRFDYVYRYLEERFRNHRFIVPHRQYTLPCRSADADSFIWEECSRIVDQGGEGLILRAPHSMWAAARSKMLLKVKALQDAEATVIGYTWGRETDLGSKLLGMMGALIVSFNGKRLELSGFTDEERTMCLYEGSDHGFQTAYEIGCRNPGKEVDRMIHNPRFPLGATITFKYRELTDTGIPKEARYWRRFEE